MIYAVKLILFFVFFSIVLPCFAKAQDIAANNGDSITVIDDSINQRGAAGASRYVREDISGLMVIPLNGDWEFFPVKGANIEADKLPSSGWDIIPVPSDWRSASKVMELCPPQQYNRWKNLDSAWYKHSFSVPVSWKNKHVKAVFSGVNIQARVFCNGKEVGRHLGAGELFSIDLTGQVNFEDENTLLIEVHPQIMVEGNKVSTPKIGSGIWQGVMLQAVPPVRVQSVQVTPSVRQSKLSVKALLINESDAPCMAQISSAVLEPEQLEPEVLRLPPQTISIPAGQSKEASWDIDWNTARFWSPADPYLYTLLTSVKSKTGTSENRTRFGFREFWAEKGDFFLNSKRIRLRGDTLHSPFLFLQNPAAIRSYLRYYKSKGSNFMRAWGIFPSIFFDIADEEGFLIHSEFDPRVKNWEISPRMCQISEDQIKQWVNANRNHPSIIFWTAENEGVISQLAHPQKFEAMHKRFKLYKKLDPSRLLQAEGDPCVAGLPEIDIYNYHDYSDMRAVPVNFFQQLPLIRQPRYDKPLLIGETYLGLFGLKGWSYLATLYLGEEQWRNPQSRVDFSGMYKQRVLEAWRIHDVDGIQPLGITQRLKYVCPPGSKVQMNWSDHQAPYPQIKRLDTDIRKNSLMVNPGWFADAPEATVTSETKGIFSAYQPVIITMAEDWDWAYYAGEKVEKTAYAINDDPRQQDLELVFLWALREGDKKLLSGSQPIKVPTTANVALPFSFTLPSDIRDRKNLRLEVFLLQNESAIASNSYRLDVFPVTSKPTLKSRIGLYDPTGLSGKLLQKVGIPFKQKELNVSSLKDIDLLILGYCSMRKDMEKENAAISEFIRQGGKVLAFEQESAPTFVPGELTLTQQGVNYVFPRDPSCLNVIPVYDWQLWRGDQQMNHMLPNLVSTRPFAKPDYAANFRSLLDCGTFLENTPLIEFKIGRGAALLCQLDITGRYMVDPAATEATNAILVYADSLRSTQWKTIYVLPGKAAKPEDVLADANIITMDKIGCLEPESIFLIAPGQENGTLATYAKDIEAFVEKGGTVLCLHQNKGFDYSCLPGGMGIKLSDEQLSTDILQKTTDPLMRGIGICDLSCTDYEKERKMAEYKYDQKRKFVGANVANPAVAWPKSWKPVLHPIKLITKKFHPAELKVQNNRAAMLVKRQGKGEVIICQMPLLKLGDAKSRYLLGALLNNLSVKLRDVVLETSIKKKKDGTLDLTLLEWRFQPDPENKGLREGWQNMDFDASGWSAIVVPGYWEQNLAFATVDGYAWYRVKFNVPEAWKGKDLRLKVGGIDDCDWTYCNGHLIGKSTPEEYPDGSFYKVPREYVIKAGWIVPDGENVLALRVWDQWADAGIYQGPVSISPIK